MADRRSARRLAPATSTERPDELTAALLEWYDRHRRALPWRALPGQKVDPYAIWLSEIMLQQTTVQAVKPFFAKFLTAWPSVERLAAAPVDEVMRAWAGLGYYSRARNLHACARAVVEAHAGVFPTREAELRRLPGIGAYTAAAIATIAFGRHAAVVDGNVERVLTRIDGVATPLPQARPAIRDRMATLTPEDRPGDFAQAVMDLGATICTPKSPACAICPLTRWCVARQTGSQSSFPVKPPKRANPTRHGVAYYIQNDDAEVLVRTRPAKGLLGGMTELPGTAWLSSETPDADQMPGFVSAGKVKHVFTHFTLLLDIFVACPMPQSLDVVKLCGTDTRWVDYDALNDEALPTLMRNAIAVARRAIHSSGEPADWVS